jgi:MFS family permease
MPTLIMTSTFNLGANVVWIPYNLLLLPLLVQNATTPATKATILGALVGITTCVAVVANVLAGIISDHTRSRFGRRRPILIGGMLLAIPFLLFPVLFHPTLLIVCLSYLGMQVFTNVSAAAFQPTLADFIPPEQRGVSAGLKGLFTLAGAAIGVGGITALFAANQRVLAYLLIPLFFTFTTLLNAFAMRKYDKPTPEVSHLKLGHLLIDMFRIQRRSNGFFWFIFGSFLIYIGVSGFQFFGVYYIETILHITNQNILASTVVIVGLISLLVSMVFSIGAGILSDKVGRRNIIIASALLAAVVGLIFPIARTLSIFLIFAALYSASSGVILSVDTALTSDLVPQKEAGKYMAYANLATGLSNVVAPPIFGLILNFQGAPTLTSFILFFIVSAIAYIGSALVMLLKVPDR